MRILSRFSQFVRRGAWSSAAGTVCHVLPEKMQADIWCPTCGEASRIVDVRVEPTAGIEIGCGCFLPSCEWDVQIVSTGDARLDASAAVTYRD